MEKVQRKVQTVQKKIIVILEDKRKRENQDNKEQNQNYRIKKNDEVQHAVNMKKNNNDDYE